MQLKTLDFHFVMYFGPIKTTLNRETWNKKEDQGQTSPAPAAESTEGHIMLLIYTFNSYDLNSLSPDKMVWATPTS